MTTQVFRIDITDSTGEITFTQFENLDHSTADSSGPYSDEYLTLATGQLSVQQSITLTDGDSDTATATDNFDLGGNFRIGDDGPQFTSAYSTNTSPEIVITAPNTTTGTIIYDTYNLVDWLYGADSSGEVILTNNSTTTAVISVQDAEGTLTVELRDSANNTIGDIEFNQAGEEVINICRQSSSEDIGLSTVAPGKYSSVFTSTTLTDVTITADEGAGVNVSSLGLAQDNQNFTPGESITFTFSTSINDFTFGSTKNEDGSYQVTVNYSDASTVTLSTPTILNGTTWSLSNDGSFDTTKGVDEVTVEVAASTGNPLNIGNFQISSSIDPGDIDYNFSLKFVDSDQDTTSPLEFDILLSGSTTVSPLVTPVIIDLDGNGIQYRAINEGILSPYYEAGLTASSWIAEGDGILVYDQDSSGGVTNSSEFVLTSWGEDASVTTDLKALSTYFDSNKDGVFDSSDETSSKFGIWQDINADGFQQDGEFSTLAELGIKSIGVNYVDVSMTYTAADGDVKVFGQSEVIFEDGSTTTADDAAFTVLNNLDEDKVYEEFSDELSSSQQEKTAGDEPSLTEMVNMLLTEQPVTESEITQIHQELTISELINLEEEADTSLSEIAGHEDASLETHEEEIEPDFDAAAEIYDSTLDSMVADSIDDSSVSI